VGHVPCLARGCERLAAGGDYERHARMLSLATSGRAATQLAEARTLGERKVRVAQRDQLHLYG